MIRTIFVILIYVNINSNFPILCISKQYIYISRLQEGTEFSSIEVSSRVKPSRNGVCVHQNRWPALESARPSVTSVLSIPYCLVLDEIQISASFAEKSYIYKQNISIPDVPSTTNYLIGYLFPISIGYCLTYRQPTVEPIRVGRVSILGLFNRNIDSIRRDCGNLHSRPRYYNRWETSS